jgi:hypothetical protein
MVLLETQACYLPLQLLIHVTRNATKSITVTTTSSRERSIAVFCSRYECHWIAKHSIHVYLKILCTKQTTRTKKTNNAKQPKTLRPNRTRTQQGEVKHQENAGGGHERSNRNSRSESALARANQWIRVGSNAVPWAPTANYVKKLRELQFVCTEFQWLFRTSRTFA